MKREDIGDSIPRDELSESLDPKKISKEKKISTKPSQKDFTPHFRLKDVIQSETSPQLNELNKKIRKINEFFDMSLAYAQEDEGALKTISILEKISQRDLYKDESPILSLITKRIEEKIGHKAKWKKKIILEGVKALWILARRTFPGFKSAEDVLSGIEERNWKRVVGGFVKIVISDGEAVEFFSWIIRETKKDSASGT